VRLTDSRPAGILSSVGNTPLIRLSRLYADAVPCAVYAKLEGLNVGGSSKDRPAVAIIGAAIDSGAVVPGETTVVESSSGNFALGLAVVCKYYDIDFICVVDPKTPDHSISILRAYGVTVDIVTTPDPATGEYLPARLARVTDLCDTIAGSYWPNQYGNPQGPLAHHRTMQEIVEDLDGPVDYLLCATSTCGTLRGCAEYVARHELKTRIVAVDAEGSAIFGQEPRYRSIPGHGAAFRPPLYAPGLESEVVHVSDADCVRGCRRLLDREAYLAGGSSGAVVAALGSMRARLASDANCVLILADRGERYLDTIYNDAWVAEHVGAGRAPIADGFA